MDNKNKLPGLGCNSPKSSDRAQTWKLEVLLGLDQKNLKWKMQHLKRASGEILVVQVVYAKLNRRNCKRAEWKMQGEMQRIVLSFQNNFWQDPSKAFKITKLRSSQKGGNGRKQSVKKKKVVFAMVISQVLPGCCSSTCTGEIWRRYDQNGDEERKCTGQSQSKTTTTRYKSWSLFHTIQGLRDLQQQDRVMGLTLQKETPFSLSTQLNSRTHCHKTLW